MVVGYYLFNWKRPQLSEAEEIEFGRQIALRGREQFIRDFRRSMKRRPKREKQQFTPGRILLTILMGGLCLFGLVSMTASDYKELGLRLVFVGGPAGLLCSLFTYMSMRDCERRFREWMDFLVAKYASLSEQKQHHEDFAKWN